MDGADVFERDNNHPFSYIPCRGFLQKSPAGYYAGMKEYTVVFPVYSEDGDQYVLLGEQPEGKPLAGYLNGYGGKVEPADASIEAAAKRELLEELGEKTAPLRYIGQIIHKQKVIHFYLAFMESMGGEFTQEGGMVRHQWHNLANTSFVSKMLPGDDSIIARVKEAYTAPFRRRFLSGI
jgi:ADP-ribose pyrophosphatase YjhB (NUDIX family)